MFLPGTKVTIISDVVKKDTGPRLGSVGYSVGNSSPFEYYPEKEFMASVTNIMFTRYGNEQKNREETRAFLGIIPMFPSDSLKKNAYKKRLAEFSEKLKEDKDKVHVKFARIAEDMTGETANSVYYGMIAPILSPTENVVEYSKEEWASWLRSMLKSSRIVQTLSNALNKKNSRFLENYPVRIDMLKDAMSALQDSNTRKMFVLNPEREDVVRVMRFISMMSLQYYRNRKIHEITKSLSRDDIRFREGDPQRSRLAINYITSSMFTPLFDEIKDLYAKSARAGELRPLIENLINWKKRVGSQPAK